MASDKLMRSVISENKLIKELYEILAVSPEVLLQFKDKLMADTFFDQAVQNGRAKLALEILHLQPYLGHIMNLEAITPLQKAITLKNFHLAKLMAEQQPSLVRVKGSEQMTPLHKAVHTGNIDMVDFLLNISSNSVFDKTSKGFTP